MFAGTTRSLHGNGGSLRLAYLFDPLLVIHASLLDALPHQITAVYGRMLTRQHVHFLLDGHPSTGKTIMTKLLVRELLVRADFHRCPIVCARMLVELWQGELRERLHLLFERRANERSERAPVPVGGAPRTRLADSESHLCNKHSSPFSDVLLIGDKTILQQQAAQPWTISVGTMA